MMAVEAEVPFIQLVLVTGQTRMCRNATSGVDFRILELLASAKGNIYHGRG